MLRRVAIVSAITAGLGMTLLSGCGVRGPLYMPRVPVDPAPPAMIDPGLADPSRPYTPSPDEPAPAPAPASAPASRVTPSSTGTGTGNTSNTGNTSPAPVPSAK